jgi:streptogrisin C
MLRRSAIAAVAVLAAGSVAVVTQRALATTTPAKPSAPSASPQLLAALQRDLHLTAEQAKARLAADDKASRVESKLRGDLGARFAGAWLAPDGNQIVVGVTDQGTAAKVRAAGATPKVVTRSAGQLDTAKSTLDGRLGSAPVAVSGWYVDVASNTVVVLANDAGVDAAKSFVASAGVAADTVRVVASAEKPRTFADVRGGDPY